MDLRLRIVLAELLAVGAVLGGPLPLGVGLDGEVRGGVGQVEEEGLLRVRAHEADRVVRELLAQAAVLEGVLDDLVPAPDLRRLVVAHGDVVGAVEAAALRAHGRLVAQVPLARDRGGVAMGLEELRERRGRQAHALGQRHAIAHDPARPPDPRRVAAGHERHPRGRAHGGAGVEVRQAYALRGEPVERGRAQLGVPVATQVLVAEVVGQDQHHVGALLGRRGEAGQHEQRQRQSGAAQRRRGARHGQRAAQRDPGPRRSWPASVPFEAPASMETSPPTTTHSTPLQ